MRKEDIEKVIFNGMIALAGFLLVLSFIEKNLKIGILTVEYLFFLYLWKKIINSYRYFKEIIDKNKKFYIKKR